MAGAVSVRLDAIRANAGVRSREIAQMLGTTPQTVSRWQTGRVDPQPTKLSQLLMLEWLADQLHEFYPPDEARLWLFSPHRLLGGDRPADRIQAGRVDDVLALIDQLRDGAFV
ncbi:MAG: antitoxin Xre/MbcA/ParS toxin-binding domain-containing protein [Acidimicrobiales bacterium]